MKRYKNKKIGSIYAAAAFIGLKPEEAKKLLLIKTAKELRANWDYRKYGLKIKEAREKLEKAASRQSYHYDEIIHLSPYDHCPSVINYLQAKKAQKIERSANLSLKGRLPDASNLEEIREYTNGYGYGYGCVVALGANDLIIERHEHVTWSEKRNRHWPESTSTSYSVTLISKVGDTIATSKFDSRRGDWLQKIGIDLGLQTSKRTPITQTGSMVPIRKIKKNNLVITKMRLFEIGFQVFCVSANQIHSHALGVSQAMVGLTQKIEARRLNLLCDSDVVTIAKAKKLGFCQIGIQEFIHELGFDGWRSATAGEIREAIQTIDITPWISELTSMGILKETSDTAS